MSARLVLFVDGEPVPWARAGRSGRRTYTPKRYAAYKRLVVAHASIEERAQGWQVPGRLVAIEVTLTIVRARPRRLSRRSDPDGRIWAPARPDLDNYLKAVLDGLQLAGVIADDSQVVRTVAEKFYAARGEIPGAHISLAVL